LSLLFGKARLSFSQSSSPNFGNQEVHQSLIDDREFNLLEENNKQVILAKGEGNLITPPTNLEPNNFPTPPSAGRPSRPATGRNPFNYRTTPKAGNGGQGPEFEENSSVP